MTKPISKGARQIVDLVRAELATAQAERAVAGGKTIESRGCGSPRRDGGALANG